MYNEKEPIAQRKSWNEFRDSGLLWFVNQFLHVFGWAIIVSVNSETQETIEVYPAKVNFRGFPEEINESGYKRVTEYLKENIDTISKDIN